MKRKRSGIVLADTVMGIILTAGLTITVAKTAGWQRRASRQMNDLRVATDLAEATLIDLHQGTPPLPVSPGQSVKVESIAGGSVIPGYLWCRVDASVNGNSVSLVGVRLDPKGEK